MKTMQRKWTCTIPGKKYGYKQRLTLTATAKLEKGGNEYPYFSITGDITTKNDVYVSSGQITDEIYQYIPELRPYMKWHLTSTQQPMHYIGNASYWAMFTEPWVPRETPLEKRIEYLHKAIVYGALESDKNVVPEELGDKELVKWLNWRLPNLMNAFNEDMGKLFNLE